MVRDILVVYKKNFEAVHDRALESVKKTLDNLVKGDQISVGYTARETVGRSDFIDPDFGNQNIQVVTYYDEISNFQYLMITILRKDLKMNFQFYIYE